MQAHDKEDIRARLRRVSGQIQGLERMVEEERYCIDLLTQLSAVRGALQEVALILLRGHLLAWLYALANGGAVRPDHVVALTPLGFAGWLGLLVTALNLIPVGQLDGGHVAYALFGRRRAETLGWVAFFLLVALGIFYWSGWLTWAILIFFLGGVKHEAALNELPEPGWRRRAVGVLAFALLFLLMAPVPHRFMTALGIISPYV